MKKVFFIGALVAVVIISACSPKGNKATTTTTSNNADAAAAQLAAAKTKYPDATSEQMQKGTAVYFGDACTRCHGAKTITRFSAEELPGIIDDMARKAKISAEEKDAVLKYVMGVRLAAK